MRKSTESFPSTHSRHSASPANIQLQGATCVTGDEPTWTHLRHPKSRADIRVHSLVSHPMGWAMCNGWYPTSWYCIECLTALNSLFSAYPLLSPWSVTLALPFPGCHRVGTIQDTAFSDGLLSPSNTHVSACFLPVFPWLHSLFLFGTGSLARSTVVNIV